MSLHTTVSHRVSHFAACVMVGALVAGCSADAVGTAPDLAASFGKPVPTETNQRAIFTLPATSSTLNLVGDDLFASVYTDGKCGVQATVFAPNPNRDANLQTGNPSAGDRKCVGVGASAVPRKVTVKYPDTGVTETSATTINVRDVGFVVEGTPRLTQMSIGLNTGTRCVRINFGNLSGGDQVLVTKTSPTTWHIESQAGGSGATCSLSNGQVLAIGGVWYLDFTVTTF